MEPALKFVKKRWEQHRDDAPMVQYDHDWEFFKYWGVDEEMIDDYHRSKAIIGQYIHKPAG